MTSRGRSIIQYTTDTSGSFVALLSGGDDASASSNGQRPSDSVQNPSTGHPPIADSKSAPRRLVHCCGNSLLGVLSLYCAALATFALVLVDMTFSVSEEHDDPYEFFWFLFYFAVGVLVLGNFVVRGYLRRQTVRREYFKGAFEATIEQVARNVHRRPSDDDDSLEQSVESLMDAMQPPSDGVYSVQDRKFSITDKYTGETFRSGTTNFSSMVLAFTSCQGGWSIQGSRSNIKSTSDKFVVQYGHISSRRVSNKSSASNSQVSPLTLHKAYWVEENNQGIKRVVNGLFDVSKNSLSGEWLSSQGDRGCFVEFQRIEAYVGLPVEEKNSSTPPEAVVALL